MFSLKRVTPRVISDIRIIERGLSAHANDIPLRWSTMEPHEIEDRMLSHDMWILYVTSGPVAYCAVTADKRRDTRVIQALGVLPRFWHRGFARAMLAQIIQHFGKTYHLRIMIKPKNVRALRLHVGHGFDPVQWHDNYYTNWSPQVEMLRAPR